MRRESNLNWIGVIVRFIVSALVLMFIAYVVPGFRIANFGTAIIAAVVIALLGWVVEAMIGDRVNRWWRGIIGFIASAVVIWAAQFIVPGMNVTAWGAVLASLVIGIIDLLVPVEVRGRMTNIS
ncbi:phage holin family protein [Alicyclobacillus mengziensis]|uniref:Phage holin family protein n=1 Tax=Alicyclobacillus mengziensis TaxID=2931921 RepID=A0A9X7VYT7_9BACL|nr:phage holin family protein [Alicyclobacillus mengziensis]